MDEDAAEVVRRWEASGGGWEVVAERGDQVTVALLTCDRGERVGTAAGSRAELEGALAGRRRSDD